VIDINTGLTRVEQAAEGDKPKRLQMIITPKNREKPEKKK
jgi:hypothetical protein